MTLSLADTCVRAVLLLASTLPVVAGTLRGVVRDEARLPVPGASVTLTCPHTYRISVTSGAAGDYAIGLDLRWRGSACLLTVEHAGFRETSVRVDLDPEMVREQDLVLAVAPVEQAVTITERAGYVSPAVQSGTKTLTPLRDVPQSITVVNREQINDQLLASVADAVRYVPGVMSIQGENNRDQLMIRGNSTSADFFLNGVRDDVQYYRDLYNLDRVEVLKGPNAMIFGRGGGGGVVNRMVKEAVDLPIRELTLDAGSFGEKRAAVDLDQPLGRLWAARLNGVYQHANSFRDFVGLERYGVNPSLAFTPSGATRLVLSAESFHDRRIADRGVPSFEGRPLDVSPNTYFGNPDQSRVRASVNTGSVAFEHHWTSVELHNRTLIGDYDRGYQNFVPGAVNSAGTMAALSAYNNATQRRNVFHQADLSGSVRTGALRHRWLGGVEVGRQSTDNFRNTGYFNNSAVTSIQIPVAAPLYRIPVTFRQSATDADNHLVATVAAGYVQDQLDLTRHVQVVAGLRFDRFHLRYRDNRSGLELERPDRLLSPRVGVVFKPVDAVSLYGSYSVSYLPSSGDQFSSLTTVTQQVKPEKFNNLEAGFKWDLSRGLSFSAAIYRLDRTNTRSTDPSDPTRIIQTGSQRTDGGEISLTGNLTRRWSLLGGYGRQHAEVTSATVSARAGATVAQVPRNTFTLWNRYALSSRLAAGFGLVNRSDMFAAIDNTVILPGYTRADAAVYYSLTERVRVQANVENVFDQRYTQNADNNNNISPGAPRAVRVGLIARF